MNFSFTALPFRAARRAPLTALVALATLSGLAARPASAQVTQINSQVLQYGDQDVLTGSAYSSDPTAGTTLSGLSAGTVTLANNAFNNSFYFSPSATDFSGTDQIYVGSIQTGSNDGYASYGGRRNGPLTLVLDYSSLVGAGQTVTSLTLGLAANDFQFQSFGNPFSSSVNGINQTALTNRLNAFNQTGPVVQFFTIGLDPLLDNAAHTLTLTIDEGGNGGDGYAIDFATVGVTTTAVSSAAPEPGSIALLTTSLFPLVGFLARRKRE